MNLLHLMSAPSTYKIQKKSDDTVRLESSQKGIHSLSFYGLAAWFLIVEALPALRDILAGKAGVDYFHLVFPIVVAAGCLLIATKGMVGRIDFDRKKNRIVHRQGMLGNWLPTRSTSTKKEYSLASIKRLRVMDLPQEGKGGRGGQYVFRVFLELEGAGIGQKMSASTSAFVKGRLEKFSDNPEAELLRMQEAAQHSASLSLVDWVSAKEAFRVVSELERHLRLGLVDQFKAEMGNIKERNRIIDAASPS